jgi:hypothetical protein
MNDKTELHAKSFEQMEKKELSNWIIQNIGSLSAYQLKQLCKRIEEMNNAWKVAEKMISVGIKMGE